MSKCKYKILVTNGSYKHTLGVVRNLSMAGFEVDVIGSPRCLSYWSRYVSKIAFDQNDFREERFDEFLTFLSKAHYDVLLPIGAKSVSLASKHKTQIERFCKVPVPSSHEVDICMDKFSTISIAEKLGILIPRTWNFSSIKEIENHINELIFPIVIKSRNEISRAKPVYIYTGEELDIFLKNYRENTLFMEGFFPIIQQYVKGTGCGFFALYRHGECKRIFMHQRVREIPPSGGASCCAVSIYEVDLLTQGKRLLDSLNWHGVAMVEFKRQAETGNLYLMEINPKFWGSLDLALACGVDFPVWDVHMAMGRHIPYSEDYEVGLKFHWPLDGDIFHVLQNPSAFREVLSDCLNPNVISNIWVRDPLPCLFSIILEMRTIFNYIYNRLGD